MKKAIAEELAFQLTQEDQVQTSFSDIEVIENDGPDDAVVRCLFQPSGRAVNLQGMLMYITINTVEEDE